MDVVAKLFIIAFCCEFILRLLAEQRYFYTGRHRYFNMFESIINALMLLTALGVLRGAHFSALRVLRVLRTVRSFLGPALGLRKCRFMMVAIMSSCGSLFWALVLLFVVVYCFAVYLQHVMLSYLRCGHVDSSIREAMMDNWDGMLLSIRSLVYSITGGKDWADLSRPFWLIHDGPLHGVLYIVFVVLTVFGLLNMLVAIFTKEAADILTWDHETVLEHELANDSAIEKQFRYLFDLIDRDDDKFLTAQEIKDGLEDKTVSAYFHYLHTDTAKNSDFFNLLDTNDDGRISQDEFVKGCFRLRTQAKPLEMQSLIWDCKMMSLKVDEIGSGLAAIAEHLHIPISYEACGRGVLGDPRRASVGMSDVKSSNSMKGVRHVRTMVETVNSLYSV